MNFPTLLKVSIIFFHSFIHFIFLKWLNVNTSPTSYPFPKFKKITWLIHNLLIGFELHSQLTQSECPPPDPPAPTKGSVLTLVAKCEHWISTCYGCPMMLINKRTKESHFISINHAILFFVISPQSFALKSFLWKIAQLCIDYHIVQSKAYKQNTWPRPELEFLGRDHSVTSSLVKERRHTHFR